MRKFFCINDVLDREHSGWLNGLTEDEIKTPLCYKTKVSLNNKNPNGEIIRVEEGIHKEKILTLPYKYKDKKTNISYLSTELPASKISLKLFRNKKILFVENVGKFNVEVDKKIVKGKYNLLIPERPILKILNPEYFSEKIGGSRFVETWFRMISEKGKQEDIFLHYGSYSKGCVTVLNNRSFSVWNKIYLTLMSCRLNNKYLAALLIT
ncbi:MAG: hypothetical protein UR68_C0032G0013 [Candidatus Roizmanbacteria bacterium GW2011_GWA2_35_19]|uniref:Uncharacterized protein n=2 Tax=Candidatus Roizmaniibacteriota TaxID=1752723 RepID=A0A0G0EWQ1_9BACT|nr:MAG: hypothetical protein UR63_C0038G0006 [Candidatus Roizmanbacteria bacterium GW2011_GWC2_35_12]KKP71562.1 MAG: hypothetical protein UR68_C0032G0013 [Candidatus Roizmanbacteria bacterium GW2011_GWA2_35_19]